MANLRLDTAASERLLTAALQHRSIDGARSTAAVLHWRLRQRADSVRTWSAFRPWSDRQLSDPADPQRLSMPSKPSRIHG